MHNIWNSRSPERSAPRATWVLPSAWVALAALVVLTLLSSLDRQIIILMGESLRVSLDLNDTQLGVLQGVGISLIAGIAALGVGWAADRHDLRIVLLIIMALWGTATVIGANSQTYPVLLLSSIGMGLLETAMAPIVYAYIPRAFPERTRALANSVYATLNLLGIGFGIALAGEVVKAASALSELQTSPWEGLATWRAALLLTAVVGLFGATLVAFLRASTPPSATGALSPLQAPSMWAYLQRHRRAVISVFCAFGLGGMGLTAVTTWLPVIAQRSFGATADEVASSMATSYLVGIVIGAIAGTFGMRLLRRRIRDAAPIRIVAGGCTLAAVACGLLSLASSPIHAYLLLGVMVCSLIAGVVLAPTMMQDMAYPGLMSRVVALGSVISIALTSLGSSFVGILSDSLVASSSSAQTAASIVGAVALLTAASLLVMGERPYLTTVAEAWDAK